MLISRFLNAGNLPQQAQKITWSDEISRIVSLFPEKGVFLTGIEGSDPFVNGVRRNQFKEAFDFYEKAEQRIENIRTIGVKWLRFGPPYSQTHVGNNIYDFSFTDRIHDLCREKGITVMADLLHFGLPEWMHEKNPENPFFQNEFFPELFAQYAKEFARRYKEIKHFTLINEPLITALFSSKWGMWNEKKSSRWNEDREVVIAFRNISRAIILAKQEIEKIWDEEKRDGSPIFIQNDSFEAAYATPRSGRKEEADLFNLRRFAALDLVFGKKDELMKKYLIQQGMPEPEYEWFMKHGNTNNTVLGIDHYPTCVHVYQANRTVNLGPRHPYQLYNIIKVYWDRYQVPLMHTEVNAWPRYAKMICQKTYDVIVQLRKEGYPILGMGWYGDEYQAGWHHALCGPRGYEESPVGLSYKGTIQPVGKLFSRLSQQGLPAFDMDMVSLAKELAVN
ncbi:family 1 glycosylhydrolase [Candidatus Pacearchaeota archaeon]|nr:family 1 glycosylhydrolase [Candidatus Pacearchaeota archaeon]